MYFRGMEKRQSIDQLGRCVEFNFPPQRIVSLVPSQTELLFDLGTTDRVVGITKFCVHPKEWFRSKPKVGGTKTFHLDIIDQLKPDLIIGNKEENEETRIKQLFEKYPVWMSDIVDWTSSMKMITEVGDLVNEGARAGMLTAEIQKRFESIKPLGVKKVLYLIWKKPWMAAGKGTFIDTLLAKIGLTNSVEAARYPSLSMEEIINLAPEIILLSSEPFPFKEKHIVELRQSLPQSKILLVDGEMFSWYGSRLLHAPDYFSSLKL